MALGLGQGAWSFASPDFPQGAVDYASTAQEQGSPFDLAQPYVGGDPDTTSGVGPVHIDTGTGNGPSGGRAQHWSNLLDWKHGPLFWLAVATILYFGLMSLHVGARAGHFRIGASAS